MEREAVGCLRRTLAWQSEAPRLLEDMPSCMSQKWPASMAEVVLVERNATLRETVRQVLVDAGHTVYCEYQGMSALTNLVQHPRPLVAVLGETSDPDYSADLLVSLLDVGIIPSSHSFILLSPNGPHVAPAWLAALCAAHHIPTLHTPVDAGVLLRAVDAAADRLPEAVAPVSVAWPNAAASL